MWHTKEELFLFGIWQIPLEQCSHVRVLEKLNCCHFCKSAIPHQHSSIAELPARLSLPDWTPTSLLGFAAH